MRADSGLDGAMISQAMIIIVSRPAAKPEAAKHALNTRDAVHGQREVPRLRDICAKSVKNQRGEYPTEGGESQHEMLALTSRMHWSRQQKSDVFPGRGKE